jgi:hypothetical protein
MHTVRKCVEEVGSELAPCQHCFYTHEHNFTSPGQIQGVCAEHRDFDIYGKNEFRNLAEVITLFLLAEVDHCFHVRSFGSRLVSDAATRE